MSNAVNWDTYALCYDALLQLQPYQDLLFTVAQKSLGDHTHCHILDASCGTGNFILKRASLPKRDDAVYLGVDYSEAMLRRAQQKCSGISNCSFQKTNLNSPLPFLTGEFDQVVSINTLYAVENPEKTLREFYRVLKPGGKLLLVNPTDKIENGLILKEHAKSDLPDDFWTNGHSSPEKEELLIRTAIHNPVTIEQMLYVAAHNRAIAKEATFHLFSEHELLRLTDGCGLKTRDLVLTYADQAFFITAIKE